MAFFSKNFWENDREAPPPVVPPRPMTEDEKRVALIQELLASENAPAQSTNRFGDWVGNTGPGPNNMLGAKGVELPVTTNMSVPGPERNMVSKPTSNIANSIGLGAKLGIGNLGDMKGAGNAAGGIWDAISGIAQSVIAAAPENRAPESVEDLYNRLRGQYGGVSYNGPSGDEMAKEEFDPQFAILKEIAKQQQSRYNTGKGDIAGMYASMVQDATKGRSEDKAMYDAATQQINNNYKAASGNVSGNVQASNAATAETLKMLGQDAAVAKVSGDANSEAAKQLGYLAADQQASANLNTTLGANEYSYDTAGIANTRQAGANSQQDLLQQYLDRMAQNDMQRLDLTGQQEKTANQYDLQIQELLGKQQENVGVSIDKMVQQIMQERQNQSQNQYRQADMDLDLARFGLDQSKFDADQSRYQNSQMDPYSALQNRAAGLYGDPGKASAISQQIFNVYKDNPNVKSIGDFLRSFVDEGNNLDPATQTLASYFITQILKNQQQ